MAESNQEQNRKLLSGLLNADNPTGNCNCVSSDLLPKDLNTTGVMNLVLRKPKWLKAANLRRKLLLNIRGTQARNYEYVKIKGFDVE